MNIIHDKLTLYLDMNFETLTSFGAIYLICIAVELLDVREQKYNKVISKALITIVASYIAA
jgi:hypothetical protein